VTTPPPPPPPTARAEGTLYVVATPIGNLGDITLRALEVLRTVPLVAAEDTRHTRRLWSRYELTTRLTSFHAQSPPSKLRTLLDHLTGGEDLAVVTDAGTPLVSDPGADLVATWAGQGGRVVPVPGASAVLAALVASGIPAARWGFEGFLPRRGRERRERLERLAADERASVLFEAPGRAAATLRDLAGACGTDRPAAVARELTKLHEEVRRGSLGELADEATADPPRGEVTIVVAGRPEGDPSAPTDVAASADDGLEAALHEVESLVAGGLRRTVAARRVAQARGLPRRVLFAAGSADATPAREEDA
jgi:16S rRNA (cytidine1402-2'-O)-methyltransferase